MAKNQLFNHLKENLRNASRELPQFSTVALGFTQSQMLTMNLKKPRLLWYDITTKTFYDQGDSTKIKKSEWMKINTTNYKKDKPLKDIKYYIPMNGQMIAESNQPLE